MAQRKSHEVDSWLRQPDARTTVVLVYGPDRGLVSERAKRFAEKSGVPLDDPFSVVRIDASAAEGEGGRLLEEARMVSMFSSRRLIWVRDAGNQKPLAEAVAELAAAPSPDALILIEAGDLKKGAPLRSAVENAQCAMALPCYPDEERSVDALIEEEMRRNRLAISPETRALLRASLGGDRMATRGELEKLGLYAAGKSEVTEEDVRALVGDASAVSGDSMVEHVAAGEGAAFSALFARHVQTPQQLHPLLAAAIRQFQTIHLLRGRMDASRQGAAAAVAGLRPPPFGPRRALLERALARWTAASAQAALTRLQGAVLESRRRPDLALALAERALLDIARLAQGRAHG
jgi:DNA polymerase III subunit delta